MPRSLPCQGFQRGRRRHNPLTFEAGVAHYDPPPPDRLEDVGILLAGDHIRFANELRAWIEVEQGTVVGHGPAGQGHVGRTTICLGWLGISLQGVALPDLHPESLVTPRSVRFVQTTGGRTAFAVPRGFAATQPRASLCLAAVNGALGKRVGA